MKKTYLNILVVRGRDGEWLVVARIPAVELILASFRSHGKAKRSARTILKALGKTVDAGASVPYHPLGTWLSGQEGSQKDVSWE